VLTPETAAYVEAASAAPPPSQLPLAQVREATEARAAEVFGPAPEVASIAQVEAPAHDGSPIPVRVYRAEPGSEALPLVVYVHGGGWTFSSIDTYESVCRELAARTGCVVACVGYRKAPEHRFPTAHRDVEAATLWLVDHAAELGVDPARVCVIGDSAGGTMTAALAKAWPSLPGDRPALALQVLVYPILDPSMTSGSWQRMREGYVMTEALLEWHLGEYVEHAEQRLDPALALVTAPLPRELPPTFIASCQYDPLVDDGRAYALALSEAGVDVLLREYPGLVHGAWRMPAVMPSARAMMDDACQVISDVLHRGVAPGEPTESTKESA
jgi:acetyl esterase